MKKKGVKEKLKPVSFYALDAKDVIRSFMQVDSKELQMLEEYRDKTKVSI